MGETCGFFRFLDDFFDFLSCYLPLFPTEKIVKVPLRSGHANLLCIVPILVYVPPKRVHVLYGTPQNMRRSQDGRYATSFNKSR